MKILIVDDEQHVRECIDLLADWKALGIESVCMAESGFAAIACMEKEMPDIIITDIMMPGMDGVNLMDWISRNHPSVKIIVISGFSNFEFARQAVHYGAVDYLLKPIDAELLDETLRKAVSLVRRDQNQPSISKRNSSGPSTNERTALSFICDGQLHLADDDTLSSLFFDCPDLFVLDLFLLPSDCSMDEAAFSALEKRMLRMLADKNAGTVFRLPRMRPVLVILLGGAREERQTVLQNCLDCLCVKPKGALMCSAAYPVAGLSALYTQFGRACAELQKRVVLSAGTERCQLWKEESILTGSFFQAIEYGDGQAMSQIGKQLISVALQKRPVHMEDMDAWWTSLWNKAWEFFLPRIDKENGKAFKQLFNVLRTHAIPALDDSGMLSLPHLHGALLQNAHAISDKYRMLPESVTQLPRILMEYLQQHYTENISLSQLGEVFFRHPSYLARVFKNEYGISIMQSIRNFRIEQAKLFLQSGKMTIADIAGSVGYEDEKYFSRVFREVAGLSPREYQKQQMEMESGKDLYPSANTPV